MSVYVDSLRAITPSPYWPYDRGCHMFADTEEELHALAARIRMSRKWFQADPRLPHYDLSERRRKWAVELGAIEVLNRETAQRIKRAQNAAQKDSS